MAGKMDRYRQQSAARDAAKKPNPDSPHEGYPSRARSRGVKVKCPECPPDSSNFTHWDARRELWVCSNLCGFTETIEERKDRLNQ